MLRCDEGIVRALFHEHGGDKLSAIDLPRVLDAYTSTHGSPLVTGDIASQITSFARENSTLIIGIDEFLGMVRSLEQETDSSIDTSNTSLLFDGKGDSPSSPDTTLDSTPSESPAKHRSPFAPRTGACIPISSSSQRMSALLPVTRSDPDVASVSARSALIRKLARVNEQLERLQTEHQMLTTEKDHRSQECSALQREVHALRRDLRLTRDHEHALEVRVHELDESVVLLQSERDSQAKILRELDARMQQQLVSFAALETQDSEHVAQLRSMQSTCHAYLADIQNLRATCDAQREAMSSLESTVDALERVHADAERLQQQVDASRQVHEQLEQELSALRNVSAQTGPVLAEDLALYDQYSPLSSSSATDQGLESPSDCRSQNHPDSPSENQFECESACPPKSGGTGHEQKVCDQVLQGQCDHLDEALANPPNAAQVSSESPSEMQPGIPGHVSGNVGPDEIQSLSSQDPLHLNDRMQNDTDQKMCRHDDDLPLAPTHSFQVITTPPRPSSPAKSYKPVSLATNVSTPCTPMPSSPSRSSSSEPDCPDTCASLTSKRSTSSLQDALLGVSSVPTTITATHPTLSPKALAPPASHHTHRPFIVSAILVHLFLLLVGMWLGLWLYDFVYRATPSLLYDRFMHQSWIEANMLYDSLDTPPSIHAWLEHYLTRFG